MMAIRTSLVSNEMEEWKHNVKCSSGACDEVKAIGKDIKDLMREVKELAELKQQRRFNDPYKLV